VAIITKLTTLRHFISAPYAEKYIKSGFKAIKDVCKSFIKNDPEGTTCKTPLSAFCTQAEKNPFGDFWGTLQGASSQAASQVALFNNNTYIEKQVDFFKTLVLQDELITKICNNSEFWRKFQDKMPTLYSLALILENIPSTSAQIERFFSITGIICDKKRLRMTHEMIIMRSMLKANISVLEELNNKN